MPIGCGDRCCPDECLDPDLSVGCDPTPLPSPEPTPLPTPCSNLIEQCPINCWEVDEIDRPPTCTDPTVNRPDCNELPFPDGLDPPCPDCCPDECLDPDLPTGCDPTPLPSPEPTPVTPEPTPLPTPN